MNIWTIIAVVAAVIFGGCVGYMVAHVQGKKHVSDLISACKETSEKLAKLSREYEEFTKAAYELDHWPRYSSHVVMKDNLADYLKAKYFDQECDPECDDTDDDDEDDVDVYV